MALPSIKFSEIKNLFNEDDWDVGYLSAKALERAALHPVKYISLHGVQNFGGDHIYFPNLTNSIVVVRKGHTWDYTIYDEARAILIDAKLRERGIQHYNIHTNYKEAMILAGIGVRARNSLIYSYKFGFDHHITVFRFENEITDPPTDKRVNYKIWNRCVGCDDCAIKCPVKAIHNKGEPFSWWIDSAKCSDFITYGDHPTIPSVKQFWHKNVYPELSDNQVSKMTGLMETVNFYAEHGIEWTDLPWDRNGYSYDGQVVRKDGKEIDVPVCRECTSQPRCSKWNGNYPYDNLGERKQRTK